MSPRARVLVWYRAPQHDPAAIERAYEEVSRELAGTPGLLGNELLRSGDGSGRMLVMSEWESLDAFRTWEEGVHHRGATSPLRPYQDRGREQVFEIFEVAAAF